MMEAGRTGIFARRALAGWLSVLATVVVGPSMASAAPPEALLKVPLDREAGEGAGRLLQPRGIVASTQTGHFFVAELANNRVSEFTPWGEFVRAWGWGVRTGSAQAETCDATPPGCRAGLPGGGKGQIAEPHGVALDAAGNVYVEEVVPETRTFGEKSFRVQKFDPAGNFLLMFGGEVNKTKTALPGSSETERNLCTEVSGDVCGVGTPGTGSGQFAITFGQGNRIAVAPGGTVYVGDKDRIQEFEPNGQYKGQIALPAAGTVRDLALDSQSGDIYITLDQDFTLENPQRPNVYRYDGSQWQLFAAVGFPKALATDIDGNLFVVANERKPNRHEVLQFAPNGSCLICSGDGFAQPSEGGASAVLSGLATNLAGPGASEPGDVYVGNATGSSVAFVGIYGPPPVQFEPPPARPPTIDDQYAVSVDATSAVVRGRINPRFWDDTRYFVEYGTEECFKGGCAQSPVPPGTRLTTKVVSAGLDTQGVLLAGLQPETEYHYRIVADSSGGGPVLGKGGTPTVEGGEGTLLTPPAATPLKTDCPNQGFRVGASARLPDCRAFEMVSPGDKDGADIVTLKGHGKHQAGFFQSALDGGGFTYSSYRAFGQTVSAPYSSQYLAARGTGGWSSTSISPPRENGSFYGDGSGLALVSDYKLFSPSLSRAWLRFDTDPPLDPEAQPGYTALYRRDNGSGGYEALNRVKPPKASSETFLVELQGVAADDNSAVFRANDKLTTNGTNAVIGGQPVFQVYLATEGLLRLVSVLPNGQANGEGSTVGTLNGTIDPEMSSSLERAFSADGSRVYWSTGQGSVDGLGEGSIYLRLNAAQPQSKITAGQCTEPARACTVPVSDPVAAGDAQFWAASADGSRALFTAADGLYLFDLADEGAPAALLAPQVGGVLGTDENLDEIYFVSAAQLTGGETNSEGAAAQAGEPNLYRAAGGDFTFVATLSDADASAETLGDIPSPVNRSPLLHSSRVTPDGDQIAFSSTASLTGYDNAEVDSGEPAAEVFYYDAVTGELACTSCNPTRARPVGRSDLSFADTSYWAAAALPGSESSLYSPRVLSADGNHLFFESFDGLLAADTNNRRDVYEWQPAADRASCEQAIGGELFVADSGGCLSLITSGTSSSDAALLDASASGSDVFFTTTSRLVPQDPGQVDLYDARVNGGFPAPAAPRTECEGEACQPFAPPPADVTPASSAPGAVSATKKKKPVCGKGKRAVRKAGKVRCVRKGKPGGKGKRGRNGR